ncbi:MAG: T9SS type A sorting domain-containing protein [Saprospiraceae bacterium]|nr:T9SS type A sorting domain-containing protein [Saprospiraceae bacterium]
MKKIFTKVLMAVVLVTSFATLSNAQRQIWPVTTDTNSVKAGQFADSSTIYWSRTGALTPPAGHKGWVTKGIASDDPAKKDSARWVWKRNSVPTGAYYTSTRPIGSPSYANGCALFNSDLLDTKGIAGNFGAGESPSPHKGELISPVMDATGATDIVVQFHQYYRQFQSATYIQYSVDSGATWSSNFTLNSTIAVNSSTLNPVVPTNTDSTLMRVTLFGSTGTNKFMIKFVFDGDFYFWCVDDVKVLDWKLYDMQMSTFYALPPNLYVPKEQLEPMRFLADVTNKGNKAMNNVKLIVKVWNNTTKELIYADSTSQYPTSFKADTTYENRLLPKSFNTVGLAPGTYVGSYRIKGDSSALDINPANDTVRFAFVVTDMTVPTSGLAVTGVGNFNYTKENATSFSMTRNADSYWTATEPKSWRVGNYYRIVTGKTTQISTMAAVLNANAAAGRTLTATVYEWKDANNDGAVQATERTLVAYADTLVPATQSTSAAWFFFRMKDLTTNLAFRTKDTTHYLAMIEFDAPTPAATPLYLTAGFSRGAYDYQGMRYVTDSVGAARYTIILGKTTDSDWSTAGYGGSDGGTITPAVRLNILPFRVNTNDLLSEDNKMDVFPNPVGADFVNIQVDLAKQSDAAIRVMSVEGRFMAEQVIDALDNQVIRLDIKDYPAGTYIAQILTADGIMSRRFVVTK